MEIIEGGRAANYALMLLCSIEGTDFAKVIVGPAETIKYIYSSGLNHTSFLRHSDSLRV